MTELLLTLTDNQMCHNKCVKTKSSPDFENAIY